MSDHTATGPAPVNKIIPQNLTANAAYNVVGNPPSTRPESGVSNCFPGLEYDHRNLDNRFFPGLHVTYVEQGPQQGIKIVEVDLTDPALQSPPDRYQSTARDLSTELRGLPDGFTTDTSWFVVAVEQDGNRIVLTNDAGAPLGGSTAWRIIRGLRPEKVSLTIASRPAASSPAGAGASETPPRPPIRLNGWRRDYTDPTTGVIDAAYQPGELTQSLCSPWMHDFRDCACNYWASNHPDIVLPAIPAGQGTQPSGLPTDPQLDTSIDWLRNPDFPELHAQAHPTERANRPDEVSYYQINQRWQDLAIVLEGRETNELYIPRSALRDQAAPLSDIDELGARITELAGLEHLVALLYLYAYFSVIAPDEAATAGAGRWPTLAEDVTFTRSILMEVAIGEMQHLRAANQLLWALAEHTGHRPQPAVVPPASTLPGAEGKPPVPAVLAPLTLATVQLFIDIERASAFIDGQYAQVVATLKQPGYPPHLFQLAATIADEGEQHFLHFRDIHRVLAPYSTDHHPVYLRNVEPGDPTRPDVAAALDVYDEILDKLITGYQREDIAHQKSLADARTLMFGLRDKAETLAKDGVGIPFLPFRRRSS